MRYELFWRCASPQTCAVTGLGRLLDKLASLTAARSDRAHAIPGARFEYLFLKRICYELF